MTYALLVITDGRTDYITRTVPSAFHNLVGMADAELWMYDDSGDQDHRDWLRAQFPGFQHMHHADGRQGFGGAIRSAWSILRNQSEATHIFHLEDDFTFNRPVPVDRMRDALDMSPWLSQMALRRQPWNDEERAAGGIVEQYPADYTEVESLGLGVWLEHRRFFTTNPCLYRRNLIDLDWPEGKNSEGMFSIALRESGYVSAFWGPRDSPPWVHHIGDERNGTGY